MNSTLIKQALSEITNDSMTDGSMGSLWQELPSYVAGGIWAAEIVDLAEQLNDYFNAGDDVEEYRLSDYANEIADYNTQDYYSTINKRVQELSLWAYPALDLAVAELGGGVNDGTLTGLNSLYLYAAMSECANAIAAWVTNRVEELEESELANA